MKFIDLFAGIGGFRYGLEKANSGLARKRERNSSSQGGQEKVNSKRTRLSQANRNTNDNTNGSPTKSYFKCVYSNEWDKYASQIYKKHYGECDTTDITKVNAKDIPDFDLLTAGFPCQSFSIAGKRRGFEDTRGTLFFDIARILSEKRPRLVLLENVKGLLSHDKGKTFQTILGVLADLGYECEWQVLNSKHFGVPQNRERVFIVGHLGGFGGRKVFPIGEGDGGNNQSKQDDSRTSRTVSKRFSKGVGNTESRIIDVLVDAGQGQRIMNIEGLSKTLAGQAGGQGAKTGLYAMQWRRTEKGKRARAENQKRGRDYTPFSDGHRELVPKKGKPVGAITSQAIAKDSLLGNGTKIRRLTPTECARLQGFPDDWCEGLSDTQQYRCYGNAVTTNVITAIGQKILAIDIK